MIDTKEGGVEPASRMRRPRTNHSPKKYLQLPLRGCHNFFYKKEQKSQARSIKFIVEGERAMEIQTSL